MVVLRVLSVLSLLTFTTVTDVRAANSPRIVGANAYITSVIQELVLELENYGWWNLKLLDVVQTLNEHMYNWHVSGTVNYTNGFVVSIEKIDLSDFDDSMAQRNVNGTMEWIGSVRSDLNLRNVRVGFDVIVQLDDQPEQRFTGVFMHSQITIRCSISKNMHTHEYTATGQYQSLSAANFARMAYLPETHVTQVLSRRYLQRNNADSVVAWSRDIITPILGKVIKGKPFPKVCFTC